MHDWTLIAVDMNWTSGALTLHLLNSKSSPVQVRAKDLRNLEIPRHQPWGASISINDVVGPTKVESGLDMLEIHMQSGDVLRIEAAVFDLPI